MHAAVPNIDAELHEPLVFRTTRADVCKCTLETGSVWLRSNQYYRDLEDKIRNDDLEGVSSGLTSVPLRFFIGGVSINIEGTGAIGQVVQPHYLVSLHGSSISAAQREEFGGHTFGVRSLSRLSAEVLFQASQQIKCIGYRFGQVSYQHTALSLSQHSDGAAINLGGNPPLCLGAVNTDALRKRPIAPFVEQDEWRIVIFTDGYFENDPSAPLKISVATSHFYPYVIAGVQS